MLIYDLSRHCLVTEAGIPTSEKPVLVFGERPVWKIFPTAAGQPADLSGVAAWTASVAEDLNPGTPPMCRTTSGISEEAGVVSVPLDTQTDTFCGATANRSPRVCLFELCGLDAAGGVAVLIAFHVVCRMGADPGASGTLVPIETTGLTRTQVQAIAAGVLRGKGGLDFLRFTAQEDGSTIALDKVGNPYSVELLYSTDGVKWLEYAWDGYDGQTITLAHAGDYVMFMGDNGHFGRGTVLSGTSITDYYRFSMSGSIKASGNVMSLLDSTCRLKDLPDPYCFACLFDGCVSLIAAPELPATGLQSDCYWRMFAGSGIAVAPILPATKMVTGCYSSMFEGCPNLESSPALPSRQLAFSCYNSMFKECPSLVSAPELPAMELAEACYAYMFDHCTSLKFAPRLPAPELNFQCYMAMFQRCTSLRHVEADFTAFGISNSETLYWLYGTAANGRFIGWSGLTIASRGVSTVPTGWSVEYSIVRQADIG